MSQQTLDRPIRALRTFVQPVVEQFLDRTRAGANFRLIVLALSILFYWIALVFLADFPGIVPLEWEARFGPVLYFIVNLLTPFFHPRVLISLIPVVVAILGGIFVGSLYVADLFELESFWIAFQYLLGSLFGIGYPTLRIDQGDIEKLEAENSSNPLVRIGGPGHFRVHLGFAGLSETMDGLPKIYGPPGKDQEPIKTFVEGFERLRNVIDLRDQIGKVPEVRAVTYDGIEVNARDAQMLFRVHDGGEQRSLQKPYPYTKEGVRRLTYGQEVKDEKQHKWEDALPRIVRREIQDFIARHTIEEFLALQPYRLLDEGDNVPSPPEVELQNQSVIHIPRRQLTESFHTKELRDRLADQGLKLEWVGVGTWEMNDEPLSSESGEAGPGKTLTATWRDLRRATLYSSADYQARQLKRRYNDRMYDTMNGLIRIWKYGDYVGQYRCFAMLNSLQEELYEMLQILQGDANIHPPADIQEALAHIHSLIRPMTLGDQIES